MTARRPSWLHHVGTALACYAVVAGIVSLLGWALDIPRLTDWEGAGISIQPNPALAAVCAGLSLFLLLRKGHRRATIVAGLATTALGGTALFEHLSGIDLGIDSLLRFGRQWGTAATVQPGRMGPPAATSWTLLGTGLVLAALGRPGARRAATALAVVGVAIASLSVIGHAFGADRLYALPRLTAIAFQTATMVLAVALGLLATLPEHEPVRTLIAPGAAGLMARRILPFAILVPVLLSAIPLLGKRSAAYDTAFGAALRTVAEVVLLTAVLWWALRRVQKHETQLIDSEAFNHRIIESSRDCICVLDLQGKPLAMNSCCHSHFGGATSQSATGSWAAMWNEESRAAAATAVRQAAAGSTDSFVGVLTTGGQRRWWEVSVTPIRSADGSIERLLAVSRDVTDAKQAQDALRWSEAELRRHATQLSALLETAAICIHRIGPDGTILWANEAELRTFGYPRAEYVGRSIRDFHVDHDVVEEMLARLFRGEPLRDYEARIRCQDGSIKHVLVDSTALWEDGRFVHSQCFTRDVTEQRRIHETRAALAAIVEASDDAIVSKTLDGIIMSWNQAAERLFGYRASEAVGRSIEMIIPPELRHEEHEILQRLRRGERIAHYETVRVAKSGARLDISLSVSPVRDGGGRIVGAAKVGRDITEKKRAEAELRRHREHLQKLVEERTAALEQSHQRLRSAERLAAMGTLSAGLGHDVGNLLVPVRVHLENLAACGLPPGAADDLRAIRTSTEYLQRLVNGLRMLATDPAARPVRETTDLAAWWADAHGVLRTVLPRGVTLEHDLPEDACVVHMPRTALTQAVFNLVQNSGDALRERGTGRVVVRARVAGDTVLLSIADDGPGMTREVQAHCMEPFFTTKARGISTGLGLALVYGLVREAGGRIDLQSEPGQGTTFTLALPRAASTVPPDQMRCGRAVVEVRDPRLRSFVAGELTSLGYQVDGRDDPHPTDVFVLDDPGRLGGVSPGASVVLLAAGALPNDDRVRVLGERPTFGAIREALRDIARAQWAPRRPVTAPEQNGGGPA